MIIGHHINKEEGQVIVSVSLLPRKIKKQVVSTKKQFVQNVPKKIQKTHVFVQNVRRKKNMLFSFIRQNV